MKAVIFEKQGGLEVLQYRDVPDPRAGRGEVVVRIKAAALNRLDIWVREVLPDVPLPHIAGSDGAGEIAEVGHGLEELAVGDRVCLYPGLSCGRCEWCQAGDTSVCLSFQILGRQVDGTYAELVRVPAANAIPIPDDLTYNEAAAFPLTFLTAWHMLVTRARVRAGESVLIQAAGSGLGVAAIQIAKLCGTTVIATAGTDEKVEKAKQLGADLAINYAKGDFSAEVLRLTEGRGVDVVFEHTGPATWEGSIRSLARNGRLVTCGATTGPKVDVELRYVYSRQISIIGSMLGTRRELLDLTKLVAVGKLRPIIDRAFHLSEAALAQRRMQDRGLFGKLILNP